MSCYHPLVGYYSRRVNPSGKRSLVFNSEDALIPEPVHVPCGRCIGCRLDRSMMWALRCVHEASLYEHNCFITLTFNDQHLLPSLDDNDFRKFMKRLRQAILPKTVRYFHCGEYGEQFARPHHHACLFGYDFPDKVLLDIKNGHRIFVSQMLGKLWDKGFHTIGDVTFESAAYVARYVLKKWSKEDTEGEMLYDAMRNFTEAKKTVTKTFKRADTLQAESWKSKFYDGRLPEYITMSKRPGIGEAWYNQYHSDIYSSGFALMGGKKIKPPRYYDEKFEEMHPWEFAKIKGIRLDRASKDPDNTPIRLRIREKMKQIKTKLLTRGFENGS